MALVASVITRLDEARAVLEVALAAAPDAKSRAMVIVELGWVAAKQGRAEDALALVREARTLWATTLAPGKPVKDPPVLDAIVADAFVRLNRWSEAAAPAKACTERAPRNTAAWAVYARVLTAIGDYSGALAATARGLALSPRDPDLLRSQATSLAGLKDPQLRAAQDAYTRFRSPDEAAWMRIQCARQSERCMRDRNSVHVVPLRAASAIPRR
jgi:predicted Zn-dependent protease